MVNQGEYRGDIDGLRAIAVAAVVLFHAGAPVPGGFVGGDVFFVISGYLITSLVAADLDANRFSLKRFWERRIRRIWPASLSVTMATLVVGWFVLLPRDYRAAGNAAVAQVAMLSNVYFWIKTDYFADWAELDPLLHMWSLSVEEQFYLFLPVLMLLLWPLGRTWCIGVLASLTVASFAASVLSISRSPSAVFYLLPFRSWELLAGSLLALSPFPAAASKRWREMLGVAGVCLILQPCFSYDRATSFPGAAALKPCLGALALIVAGEGAGSSVSRLLEMPPLRLLGKMSYSVYLWHWPLLAFLRYTLSPVLPAPIVVAAMAALIPLSWISYRWIEGPPRAAATPLTRQGIVVAAILATVVVGLGGGVIRRMEGMPFRFSDRVLGVLAVEPFCREWECREDSPNGGEIEFKPIGGGQPDSPECFLLWGDSHGMAISPAIDAVARELGVAGHAALRLDAIPLPGRLSALGDKKGGDPGWYDQTLTWVRLHQPRHIILCARWSYYMRGSIPDGAQHHPGSDGLERMNGLAVERIAAVRADFEELVEDCQSAGTTLWVLLEVPYQPQTPRERGLEAHWSGDMPALFGIDRETHERSVERSRAAIGGIISPALRVVDLAEPFFGDADRSVVGRDGVLWYADDDHLSPSGAHEVLEPTIRSMMVEIARDCRQSRGP